MLRLDVHFGTPSILETHCDLVGDNLSRQWSVTCKFILGFNASSGHDGAHNEKYQLPFETMEG